MEWVQKFYTEQYEMYESSAAWARFFPAEPPPHCRRRAAAVEHLCGPGAKRILELGCGGGLTSGTMALLGHTVVAVDIVEEGAASARRIAAQVSGGKMTVVHGDFYEVELDGPFDVVCYFDGFGIGSDADQRRLLRRIAAWLQPQGCALIDVYSPWLFAAESGEVYREGNVAERSEFDPVNCRTLGSYWPMDGDESQAITQSLRCYSPADFRLLLEGTGLALQSIEPYESAFEFDKRVPLQEAEIFLAKLIKDDRIRT